MEYLDYVVLKIGKIVIKRTSEGKRYYKLLGEKMYELSNEEFLYVKKTFNSKNTSEYYSERLNSLALNNKGFADDYQYIIQFLNFLENIIPVQYQNNFYNNVSGLKLNLNLKEVNSLEDKKMDTDFYTTAAGYNTKRNELSMDPSAIKEIQDISKKTENPEEFFWREFNATLLHELTHMASTRYDANEERSLCGFDTYPPKENEHSNRGITEGMTEIISMVGIPGTVEISSGYYIECLFVNQLMQIVGKDVLLESYFGNLGTEKIEESLNKVLPNERKSKILFERIEDNFNIKDFNCEQSILGNIQMTLVDYFEEKINKDLNNESVNVEEVIKSIQIFDQMLVTPEKLSIMQKNPNNYIFLQDSIEKFEIFNQRINDHINQNYRFHL